MNQTQYSKLIYPHVKPMRKMKIGVLREAVALCREEVKNVFQNALNWLTGHELLEISEVSYQKHTVAEKVYFAVSTFGSYGCMMKGDGFDTGISGKKQRSMGNFHYLCFVFIFVDECSRALFLDLQVVEK